MRVFLGTASVAMLETPLDGQTVWKSDFIELDKNYIVK